MTGSGFAKGRRFATLFLIAYPLLATSQDSSFHVVERFSFHWNGRGKTQAILESQSEHSREFMRVRILVPGEKEFRVSDEDGFVDADGKDSWVPKKLLRESKTLAPSGRVLLLVENSANQSKIVMLLIGYAYASSPGALYVITLPDSGPPVVAFHRREMGLGDFVDLDGDGVRELVGYPCLHQSVGENLDTYDPFDIYKFSGGRAVYSLELSAKYNRRHYVWAGRGCSETLGVKTVKGKRRIVKLK